LTGTWSRPRRYPGPVVAMDRLTFEGLTTGIVTLPGRLVHVGLWLRVLRTLLDEVSMAASRVSTRSPPPSRESRSPRSL
jgi:hypothetical protein